MRINTLYTLISFSVLTHCSMYTFSFKDIRSWVNFEQHEETSYREYTLNSGTKKIFIDNAYGEVAVSSWEHATVGVTAIKQSSSPENIELITLADSHKDNTFTLKINYGPSEKKAIKGAVNLVIRIPETCSNEIHTDQASIWVDGLESPVKVFSKTGLIEIFNTRGTVYAENNKGDIVINHPKSTVKVKNITGKVSIEKASKTTLVETDSGPISIMYKKVPHQTTITATTQSGPIELLLPEDVNADLQAKTKKGVILSEQMITLKPKTVQLNKKAWTSLKKEVDGTFGTGEAQIRLSSSSSSIKILENKLT